MRGRPDTAPGPRHLGAFSARLPGAGVRCGVVGPAARASQDMSGSAPVTHVWKLLLNDSRRPGPVCARSAGGATGPLGRKVHTTPGLARMMCVQVPVAASRPPPRPARSRARDGNAGSAKQAGGFLETPHLCCHGHPCPRWGRVVCWPCSGGQFWQRLAVLAQQSRPPHL
jgi:hypothetical protein